MAHTDEIFAAEFQNILADYKKGATLAELAEEYNVSTPTISKWLEDSDEKIRRKPWGQKAAIFETHFKDIAEMYEAGAEKKTIAATFGVSNTTIHNWLTKGGYVRKKRGRTPFAMIARAHDLSGRGWPIDAIASLFKERPDDVEKWLSEPAPPTKPLFDNPGTKPRKKKRKKKVRKKRASRKENPSGPKPPKHKCKHRWTPAEKQYVFEMMQEGASVKEIYDQTGASRVRQDMIWREMGAFGRPPRPPKPERRPRPERPVIPAPGMAPDILAPPGPPELVEGPPGAVTQLPPAPRRRLPRGR